MSCSNLCFSRKGLFHLSCQIYVYRPFHIFLMFVSPVAISSVSVITLVHCVLSLFLFSLARGLSISLILFKEPDLCCIGFLYLFLFLISLIYVLIFIIVSLSAWFSFIFLFFSMSMMWEFRLFPAFQFYI